MEPNDIHRGDYIEHTVSAVTPDRIKRVIIPEVFKARLENLPESVSKHITWCEFSAEIFDHCECDPASSDPFCFTSYFAPASAELIAAFAATAPIFSADRYNFFRGFKTNGEVIDLYHPRYIF